MTAFFLGLRWFLAIVWLTAGVAKLRNLDGFARALQDYGPLSDTVTRRAAGAIPAAEVLLGCALAVGLLPEIGGFVAAVGFVSFAAAMSWNLARGRRIDCGCGLGTEALISWRLVARNALLAGVATAVALGPSGALAAFRGGASVPAGAPGYRTLVAVPMIVILLGVMNRVLVSAGLRQIFHLPRPASARQSSQHAAPVKVIPVSDRAATPARR